MYNFEKDLLTGALFLAALFSFISGEFILSTVLFGLSSILSNIQPRKAQIN